MPIRILAIREDSDSLFEPEFKDVSTLLADPRVHLWLDLEGESSSEVFEALLAGVFGIHPLIVEDVLRDAIHPKIEIFEDYIYVILRGLLAGQDSPRQIETGELDIVVGTNYVITHHLAPLLAVEQAMEDVRRTPRSLKRGVIYVMHCVIDKVVDLYLPLMTRFDEELEALELDVLAAPQHAHLNTIFDLKGSLQRLRRMGIHQKDVLEQLAKLQHKLIPEPALPFFRDVYDHFVRVNDLNESHREMVNAVLTAYMSQQSAKLNEVMKVLTLMSTIMLPLTFIAGVYGMNFSPDSSPWNMPELHWRYGYPFALAAMAATVVGLLWFFKRKDWL